MHTQATSAEDRSRAPFERERERVYVGVSGGVDSAVTALLMQQQGHDVHGLFMKNWEEDDRDGQCAAARDLADARRVCDHLQVPLRTVNFSAEYWERVFTRLVAGYRAGRTPNPDVLCNHEVKFGPFLEHARDLGAQRLATGHYARLAHAPGGGVRLLKARDTAKDQSYFLCMLDSERLAQVRFPVGAMTKGEVRALARTHGLPVHDKHDSTGLCFIGERPFRGFLKRFVRTRPGAIETPEGAVIGRHEGAILYTVGQRQGLGVGGSRAGTGEPWYVARRELARNVLVAVQGRAHPLLWSRGLIATGPRWVAGTPPPLPARLHARIRHRQPEQRCIVADTAGGGLGVTFDAPQWAVAPGQWVVFYEGEECLGGAVIERAT